MRKTKTPSTPTGTPEVTRPPLTNLVNDRLNRPLADVLAEELDRHREFSRSDLEDYPGGTTEHDDDREV